MPNSERPCAFLFSPKLSCIIWIYQRKYLKLAQVFSPQQQKQFVGNKKKLLHRAVLWDAGMQAPQPWHPWQRVQPNDPEHEHNMPKHHGIFNEMLSKTIKNLFFDKSSWVILILSDCVRTNPLALKLDKYARRMDQSRFLEVRTSRHPEARIARNA